MVPVYSFKYTVKCRCYLNIRSLVNYYSLDHSLVALEVVGGADRRQRKSSSIGDLLISTGPIQY